MAGNIKILMTTDTLGGVWTYSTELCKALEEYPVDIHLLGFGGMASDDQLEELNKLKNITFYDTPLNLEWMQHPDIDGIESKIVELCNEIHPDLLHFNNYVKPGRFWNFPVINVFHSCVLTWWKAVKSENAPEDWNNYFELVENALNASAQVIFPSQAMLEEACETYRISKDGKIIPNARELNFTENIDKEKIILCAGRVWDEAKNLKILCSVAEQLTWPVYVAGENRHPETAEESSLKNVNFLGKLNSEEMKYWFSKAEIYVNPAFYEPFGLSVLEAAQSGCALVLSRINSLQEIWKDAALYFNPTNEKKLKQQVFKLINEKNTRKLFRQKAKNRYTHFSRQNFGRQYFEVYQNLIERMAVFRMKKPEIFVEIKS